MTGRDRDNLLADLSAYLDGELSPERARQVEQELAESAEARQMLEELRTVADELATLPRLRAPDSLTASMFRQAEHRVLLAEPRGLRQARWLRITLRAASAAAVLVACVLVGYRVLQPPLPQRPVQTPAVVEHRAPEAERSIAAKRADDKDVAVAARPAGKLKETAEPLGAPAAVPAAPAFVAVAPAESAPETHLDSDWNEVVSAFPDTIDSSPFYLSGGAASAAPAPSVNVTVTPQSEAEYRAALATLASWSAGAAAKDKMESSAEAIHAPDATLQYADSTPRTYDDTRSAPVQQVFQVSPADVPQRLALLDLHAPHQVHVDMHFRADEARELVRAALGEKAPPAAAPAVPAAPPPETVAGTEEREVASADRPSMKKEAARAVGKSAGTAPESAREAKKADRAPTAGGGTAGAAPPPPAAKGPEDRAPATPAARGQRGAAKGFAGGAGGAGPQEDAKEEARQPATRTAESAPTSAPAGSPARTTVPAATSAPASAPGMATPLSQSLVGRLLRVLTTGPQAPGRAARSGAAASGETPQPIMFRVTVLPPPGAPAASMPTSQGATSQP